MFKYLALALIVAFGSIVWITVSDQEAAAAQHQCPPNAPAQGPGGSSPGPAGATG